MSQRRSRRIRAISVAPTDEEQLVELNDDSDSQVSVINQRNVEEPTSTHVFIPPPSLYPEFPSNFQMQMQYVNSHGPVNVDFGENTQPAVTHGRKARRENLRRRFGPYDRIAERDACRQYEYRENRKCRILFGKRWLRSGTVCLLHVLSDNSQTVISNPTRIAESIPQSFHQLVFDKMSGFLAMNPINRQCPECPHYRNFANAPLQSLSGEEFVSATRCAFIGEAQPLRHFLPMQQAIRVLDTELVVAAVKKLLEQNHTAFLIGDDIGTWPQHQLIMFSASYFFQCSEYYLSRVFTELGALEKWNDVLEELRDWRLLRYIHGNIPSCIFTINNTIMPEQTSEEESEE
jgi:hypothetical protein